MDAVALKVGAREAPSSQAVNEAIAVLTSPTDRPAHSQSRCGLLIA